MENKIACDFCGKESNKLKEQIYNGETFNICSECKKYVDSSKCRKCGTLIPDESMSLKGLCINCAQVETTRIEREKFEASMGISEDDRQAYKEAKGGDITFTNKDYEEWLTFDPDRRGFNIKDFKESAMLRRIWIMTKLQAAGYTDVKTINENMSDIEELIQENIHNVIGKHCRFSIINIDNKSELYDNVVIAHKNKVYLFSSEEDFK